MKLKLLTDEQVDTICEASRLVEGFDIVDLVRKAQARLTLRQVVEMFDDAKRIRNEWIGDIDGPNYDRHTDYAVIEQLRAGAQNG